MSQIVYVSRLMTAREMRKACAMTKLVPDRLLIGGMIANKKAAECGDTQTA
ncbi:hypothetical protein DFP93_102151 [Aneurinibacillus soli]|uniref:Uncharacterized protein n=1 Tax=Aneurinibacillus soli TaxID=1500254 RepID=A0A0U5AV43_9BACL|nr:hypothetical protein [Aneurinibacillus soli]PYE63467.1 hypothetical protein DFP93_102151 [Aneurinibacillus soli]BAU27601.1 hypothetical protein CB4_01775 [Aneurinibacillus soli]